MPLLFWFPVIFWAGIYGIAVEDDKQTHETYPISPRTIGGRLVNLPDFADSVI
jgi:hypothetical protein